MAETLDFLSKKLHPEAPPAGGFVKLNRLMTLLGPKLGEEWENSVDFCPRAAQLDRVVNILRPLLQSDRDTLDHAAIQEALQAIQGDDYISFVWPTGSELAVGAQSVMEYTLNSLPKHHVHWIERATVKAMKDWCGEWLQDTVNEDTAMEVTPERPGSLCLNRTQSGHRQVISSSFYIAFAENQTDGLRFCSVRDFLTAMDLLCASGNVSPEDVSKNRKILRSFLMGVERGDSSGLNRHFRKSRILAFPKGWFRGAPRDIMVVSKQLRIGYGEMLYIRNALGKQMTRRKASCPVSRGRTSMFTSLIPCMLPCRRSRNLNSSCTFRWMVPRCPPSLHPSPSCGMSGMVWANMTASPSLAASNSWRYCAVPSGGRNPTARLKPTDSAISSASLRLSNRRSRPKT